MHQLPPGADVIDLTSDSEDEGDNVADVPERQGANDRHANELAKGPFWGEYDLNFEDEPAPEPFGFDREFVLHPRHRIPSASGLTTAAEATAQKTISAEESRVECADVLVDMFPGICRDYVSEIYDTVSKSSQVLITHVLDKVDQGMSYPKAKETLKRKREIDENQVAARKYGSPERAMSEAVGGIRSFM